MNRLLPTPWYGDHPALERSRHIARVLVGHGLGRLADQVGLGRFAPLARGSANGSHPSQPERLRAALGELGASFIKLGQMLSTRADLLPAEYVTELSKLQDAAPAVPLPDVLAVIEEDLGAPAHRVFREFETAPLASASIGQVHGAVLHDGSRAVVKIRRPDVADTVEQDLEILSRLVDWVQDHTGFGAEYELRGLMNEFAYTLRNELDYMREGQNADRLRHAFEGDPGVRIPRVYWAHTTHRVLTMERVDGIKISDLAAIDRLGISRRAIAENAVRIFLRQVLEFGFFHADPHAGNFFVQPDASVAIVDFGMVGRVSQATQLHLLRSGLAAMEQDPEALAEELYGLGVAGRTGDRISFEKDLDHLIGRYGGFSLGELSAAAVTRELSGIAFQHKLQLPAELALLLRVVGMSEGIGLTLDPSFRYLEYARPIIRRHWNTMRSPRESVGRLGRAAVEAVELGLELPRRTRRLLGRLDRGEVQINVRHERLEAVTREFQRMTNRLSLSIVLAASVVALGVALGTHGLPGIERYVRWLFMLGFVFSLAFGAWLLLSIMRSGRR